jgi:cytochrome c peroxidase
MKKKILVLSVILSGIILAYSCRKVNGKSVLLPKLPAMPYNYTGFTIPETFSPGNEGLSTNFRKEPQPRGGGSYGEIFTQMQDSQAGFQKLLDVSLQGDYKATLGRVLFYDKNLSLTGTVACGSCHKQNLGFSDNTNFSDGFKSLQTVRNSMPVANVLFRFNNQGLFWDMRETDANKMVLMPVSNHIEMGFTEIDKITERIKAVSYYPELFKNAYGTDEITKDKISTALAQFLNTMVSFNSKFDKGRTVNFSNYTAQELAGKELFFNQLNCGQCHEGSNCWGEGKNTANIGLEMNYTDKGITTQSEVVMGDFGMGMTVTKNVEGVFKIPSLRNVALTAPYMHDGRFATLMDVINHYNSGVVNHPDLDPLLKNSQGKAQKLNLTETQKQQLIAFLNTLTDETYITDPKFSDPFSN